MSMGRSEVLIMAQGITIKNKIEDNAKNVIYMCSPDYFF